MEVRRLKLFHLVFMQSAKGNPHMLSYLLSLDSNTNVWESTKRFTFVACPYLLQTHPQQQVYLQGSDLPVKAKTGSILVNANFDFFQRFVRIERSAYLSKIKIPMVNVLLLCLFESYVLCGLLIHSPHNAQLPSFKKDTNTWGSTGSWYGCIWCICCFELEKSGPFWSSAIKKTDKRDQMRSFELREMPEPKFAFMIEWIFKA